MEPYLEFGFDLEGDGPICFYDPVRILAASTVGEVLPVLAEAQTASENGLYAAGYIAYEAAPAFDPAFEVRTGGHAPLAWFGLYAAPSNRLVKATRREFDGASWSESSSASDFASDIATIRAALEAGTAYQVNHTVRLTGRPAPDGLAWYRTLCGAAPPPYSAYLRTGRFEVISLSPELFFRRDATRLSTRPMKGTRPRGKWMEEDDALAEELARSEKDRAENLMIVDLIRNDLGRVANCGTVTVDSLFDVERYATVQQMTSSISGEVDEATSITDILKALFPSGSVTGAPKISAMQIISQLEPSPRGAYCGAIGYIAPRQRSVFNVAIRTIQVDRDLDQAVYGVGAGITWDSIAEQEYEEIRVKSRAVEQREPEFDLLETMRLESGTLVLRQRHVDRMVASAKYFDIPLDSCELGRYLCELEQEQISGSWRVRLLVDRGGAIRSERDPIAPDTRTEHIARLSRYPVDSNDRFLYHKTTYRDLYERCSAETGECDFVLLWNESGELTEFTTGNLVMELGGALYTPPVHCGLLPGTLRAEMLHQGEISERVIRLQDIPDAEGVWYINSVRGRIPISLVVPDSASKP